MGLRLSVEPATEPVTLVEAKAQVSMPESVTEFDDLLESLITAARVHVEQTVKRALINQTWVQTLDRFPNCGPIRLGRSRLQSVTSVGYIDENGDSQTWNSSLYLVDTAGEPGRIEPAYNEIYPVTQTRLNAVTVTFIAGYGTLTSAVPAPLKHAIKLLLSHWFENREAVITGTISGETPLAVERLLGPYIVPDGRLLEFV